MATYNWILIIKEFFRLHCHYFKLCLFRSFFFDFCETDYVGRIRNIFKELIFYVIFVIIATIVILSNISNYWFTHILKNEFIDDEFDTMYPSPITILEVRNLEEVWKAIENILFESVYWDYWYKRPNVTDIELMKLYLMGVPRLRQVRVKKEPCKYTQVRQSHVYCYYSFSSRTKDTQPFGLGTPTAWTYTKARKLNGMRYNGILQSYEGGGYYQDFYTHSILTWHKLYHLKNNLWLDRQSRAVFLDFTIYNANINVFLIVRIAFELPATGGVVVSYRLQNVKIFNYVNIYDFVILGLEMICFLYLIYYTVYLCLNVKYNKMNFCSSRWNFLDVFLILLGYIYIINSIVASIITCYTIKAAIKEPESHVNFEKVGYTFEILDVILSLLMLLIYVKLFKYVKLNKRLDLINATMRKAGTDLTAFIVVFFIVFLTFAILGYHLFGSHIHDFSTVAITIFTLVKSLGGEFNYFDLQEYYRYVAPVYFLLFIFFVFFVLLNMFLGIISDAYATMKYKVSGEDNYDIPNFLNRCPRRIFRRCPKCAEKFKMIDIPDRFVNMKRYLAEALYGKPEIDLFFTNYEMKEDLDYTNEIEFKDELKNFQYELYESIAYLNMINNILTYTSVEHVESFEQELTKLEIKIAVLSGLLHQLYNRIARAKELEQKRMIARNIETKLVNNEANPVTTETNPVTTETNPVTTETTPVITEANSVNTQRASVTAETNLTTTETNPTPKKSITTETNPINTQRNSVTTETSPVITEAEPEIKENENKKNQENK